MAVSKTQTSDDTIASIVNAAFNNLNDRVDKTERDFVGHLQKVEDRLDQLVDLTKTVAVLQQNTVNQTDQINELRVQFRETVQKIDTSISRIHNRLDELNTNQRDKIEIVSKELETRTDILEEKFNSIVANLTAKTELDISKTKSSIESTLEKTTKLAETTDGELKKWLNRGFGVWVFAAFVIGGAQTFAYKWLNNLEEERATISKTLISTTNALEKQALTLDAHSRQLNNMVDDSKRVGVKNDDNEQAIGKIRALVKDLGDNLEKNNKVTSELNEKVIKLEATRRR